jgi:hypothetical protein
LGKSMVVNIDLRERWRGTATHGGTTVDWV